MIWPYRPDELAFKNDCQCRCGALFAFITVGCVTLTACAAVLTGTAKGAVDCHYRERPDARVGDGIQPAPEASARIWAFVPV